MKPIGEYAEILAAQGAEEFLASAPPAFLLQDAATGSFEPVDDQPGETLFRVEPTPDPGDSGLDLSRGSLPREQAYLVIPLAFGETEANPRLMLGCAESSDLRVEDNSVSREHAWIERRGTDLVLGDNGSTTGTQVNDEPLEAGQEQVLVNGDRLMLGSVSLTFLEVDAFYEFVKRYLDL